MYAQQETEMDTSGVVSEVTPQSKVKSVIQCFQKY
jgi:hypothetical protein